MELFWHPSSGKLLHGGVRIVWLGAAILVASFELALSEQFSGTPAEACLAVNRNLSLGAQLPRTAARLKSGSLLFEHGGHHFRAGAGRESRIVFPVHADAQIN
jgi:hypothetical protein